MISKGKSDEVIRREKVASFKTTLAIFIITQDEVSGGRHGAHKFEFDDHRLILSIHLLRQGSPKTILYLMVFGACRIQKVVHTCDMR